MTLCLVPEVFNPTDMSLAFHETLWMIDPKVAKCGSILGLVAGQGIAVDNTVRLYPLFHDRQEGFPLRIGNDLGVHGASSQKKAKDRDFASSSTASFAFTPSTTITFLDFNGAHKRGDILQLLRNNLAQMVVKKSWRYCDKCRLIRQSCEPSSPSQNVRAADWSEKA